MEHEAHRRERERRWWERARRAAPIALALVATGCATSPPTVPDGSGPDAASPDAAAPVRDAPVDASETSMPEASARDASEPVTVAERAIVRDLADALAQVLEPRTTTLQVNLDASDPLTDAWVDALVERGFGIQRVPADQGPNYLSLSVEASNDPDELTWRLAAGIVEVSRDYRVAGGERVSAVSPLRVAGSRAPITVGAEGTVRVAAASPELDRVEYVGAAPLEMPSPIISLVTPSVVAGVVERSVGGPGRSALNSNRVEIGNLFFGGDAFGSLEETHRRVGRQIVVFGNDSLVLGDDNRAVLERFIDEEMQARDVVGLVGCSNGPTSLEIGNEGLALGRAARVTEALVERGVARERIYDQGCWAPVDAGDRFPGRGVVLELWRENA